MKNPTIYLLSEDSEEIIQSINRTLPQNVVFIMHSASETEETIAKIQANPAKLNLTRVNIYAQNTLPETAAALRRDFAKNFPATNLTLIITTPTILETISESDNPYDQIFVLTKKNEHGEVLPTARQNIHTIISALPLIHQTQSTFYESAVNLSSAGFWQPPPSDIEENRRLHKLANDMEQEMRRPWGLCPQLPHKPLKLARQSRASLDPNFDIGAAVAAVAAMPLRAWQLVGKTIREAEELLYKKEAGKFFDKNFGETLTNQEVGAEVENMALNEVVAREKNLQEVICSYEQQLHHLTEKLQTAESQKVRITQSINQVKMKIGEVYAIRCRLQTTQGEIKSLTAQHAVLQNHLTVTREKIRAYKALPTEAPSIPLGDAPIAISLLRDDSLLREDLTVKNASGELCRLRLVGGFGVNDFT